MLRAKALLLCAVIMLVLTACTSVTRFAYNHLDWYLYRKVHRFVDLNPAQTDATKAAIADFHHWHRTTQLLPYSDWLASFSAQVQAGPITGEDVHARIDELQNFLDACMTHLIPPTTDIMQTLSDEQVQEILANVAEEREEYEEEYLDISRKKLEKLHAKNLRETVEPWLGKLTKTQKQWLAEWAAELEPFEQLNAKQQAMWQQDVAVILAHRADKARLKKSLEGLMYYRTDEWQPELEAVLDRNQTRTYELLARLINETTDEQKKHFLDKLKDFQEDFLVLSETP